MEYKKLLSKLDSEEATEITIPSKEMVSFVKFLAKEKYKPKLYFNLHNGKVIISKKQKSIIKKQLA